MLDQATITQDHIPEIPNESVAESIEMLETRLHRGWDVISAAENRGEPTDLLFRHFLDLLHQYERLSAVQMFSRT